MSTTNFEDGRTPIIASWLNDVDAHVYDQDLVAHQATKIEYTPSGTGAVATDVQSKLREFVSVKDFGAVGDGIADDTAAIQAAVSAAQSAFDSRYIAGVPTAKTRLLINGTYKITGTISFHGTKVAFNGPGTFIAAAGTYTSSRVFVCNSGSGAVTGGAFSAISTDIFSNLNFYTTEAGLTALYAEDMAGTGNDVAACLHSLSNCRFSGFDKVFAHGQSGWGFSWDRCGFMSCNYWLYLTNSTNTYERHSATHCVFQNGGKLLYVNNPNGKVYWHGGSIDYSTGIGDIVSGYAEINSHIEYSARTTALVTISSGHLLIDGGEFTIRSENGTAYSLFDQAADNQLTIRDTVVVSDGTITNARISNRPFRHSNITVGSQNSGLLFQTPRYYGTDMRQFDAVLYGSGLTLVQDATKIEVTSSVGSGGSKGVAIDIPLNSDTTRHAGWKMTASNTAGGVVFVDKSFLTKNKLASRSVVVGDTSIAAGASGVTIDSDNQHVTFYEYEGYLRILLNCTNLGSGNVLTITALEPYVF